MNLELDKETMRNMLKTAWSSDNSSDFLTGILAHYDVTHEQLMQVCGEKMYNVNNVSDEHVQYETIQDILNIAHSEKSASETYKIQFVYVCTSLSHLWCEQVHPIAMLNPKTTLCLPYIGSNTSMPFAWIHFNSNLNTIELIKSSPNCPSLYARILLFSNPPRDEYILKHDNSDERGVSKLVILVNESQCLVTSNENDKDLIPPSHTDSFMLIVTRGKSFYRCVQLLLIEPSKNRTSLLPVLLHKI